jgi:hypothetical protein
MEATPDINLQVSQLQQHICETPLPPLVTAVTTQIQISSERHLVEGHIFTDVLTKLTVHIFWVVKERNEDGVQVYQNDVIQNYSYRRFGGANCLSFESASSQR